MTESRVIKRYSNRKLYDTRESRYVTLTQIATMVKAGEDVQVIDNGTKEDLTSVTLAQIIYEQEKQASEVLPLSALRELVRRSEARLADLREGRVGRILGRGEEGGGAEEPEARRGLLETSREAFDEWQRRVDERLRAQLDVWAPFRQLQDELGKVTHRIEDLERRLTRLSRRHTGGGTAPRPDGGSQPEGE